MPKSPVDTVQLSLRIPAKWMDEAEEIAKLVSRPGMEASRTDAFRAAIAKGFEALRAEHAGAPKPPPSKPKKPAK